MLYNIYRILFRSVHHFYHKITQLLWTTCTMCSRRKVNARKHRSPWWSQVCVSACWFRLGHTNHWTSNEKHKLYKTVFVFTNQRMVISSIIEKITFLFMYREYLQFSSHRMRVKINHGFLTWSQLVIYNSVVVLIYRPK